MNATNETLTRLERRKPSFSASCASSLGFCLRRNSPFLPLVVGVSPTPVCLGFPGEVRHPSQDSGKFFSQASLKDAAQGSGTQDEVIWVARMCKGVATLLSSLEKAFATFQRS